MLVEWSREALFIVRRGADSRRVDLRHKARVFYCTGGGSKSVIRNRNTVNVGDFLREGWEIVQKVLQSMDLM